MDPLDVDIDDYHKALEIFHSESDRAAAVLAGSFLECYLAKYLSSFMVDDYDSAIFGGFGPFSTYDQRAKAAYAFGLISKTAKSDLRFIGKIRNHFAHHPLEASFDKEPVNNWCISLSTKTLFPSQGQKPNPKLDNRLRLILAISMMIGEWHNTMLKKKCDKAET